MNFRIAAELVAEARGLTVADLRSHKRTRNIAWARQDAMWICRVVTKASLPQIGAYFHRDHTTVIHALEAAENRMAADPELRDEIDRLARTARGRMGPVVFCHQDIRPLVSFRPMFRTRRTKALAA